MTKDERWLLKEKYGGEKSSGVLELLNDFIAFQSRAKFVEKATKASAVNNRSSNEHELLLTKFSATTMQNEHKEQLLNTHGEIVKEFLADRERLAKGEPLGYVIGHAPFLNCIIYLDSRPLIPRVETEWWTERAISRICERGAGGAKRRPLRVLDLCAGSGCIGVAIAKAIPKAHVTFAELDPAHLPTIEKNLTTNLSIDWKVCGQHKVIKSDLFEKVSGQFDLILTNPPYIDPTLDRTKQSVKAHEPYQALYGGTDGMEIINRIIAAAPEYLAPEGELWLEHEPEQVEAISASAEASDLRARTHPDQYSQLRYSTLTRPTHG